MQNKVRIIARLDVKAPNLVKGIHMEGLRKLGKPSEFAEKYYQQGVDEIIYIDIVASLYNRNSLLDIVTETTKNVFVPITVGGGVRSVEDARRLLRAGADKIAINTAAIKNPQIITELAQAFGSQSVVVSIHAKATAAGNWEAFYDCGREPAGLDVIDWARLAEERGAGELLITSIDKDGTKLGCDTALIKCITSKVSIPVIAGGGVGCMEDVVKLVHESAPDGVAIGSAFHYDNIMIAELRNKLHCSNIATRNIV